jgi:hypothetical protein
MAVGATFLNGTPKCKTWLHDLDRDEAELLSDRALGFVA